MCLSARLKPKNWPIALKVTLWYTVLMSLIFILVLGLVVKVTDGLRLNRAKFALQKRVEDVAKHPNKFDLFDKTLRLFY